MYRIRIDEISKKKLLNDYLIDYRSKTRKLINDFLTGASSCVFQYSVGRNPRKTFTVKVAPGSFTYQFLKKCTDPEDPLLDSLLVGDTHKQIATIQWVLTNSSDNFKTLTAKRTKGVVSGTTIDDFNTILYEIFINRAFDSDSNFFDKEKFVKNLGIRICPYCGRSFIYHVAKKGAGGIATVKPQIDHFLPKRQYPFLGMNFFNLIPSCSQCNLSPCKGKNDPLSHGRNHIQYLMHPYAFDDTKVHMFFRLNSSHTLKVESYDVLVGYSDRDLMFGYNNYLVIDKFYAGHRVEMRNMYTQVQAFRVVTRGLYSRFGIRPFTSTMMDFSIIGFRFNVTEEGLQLMYKFKKDLYSQMWKRYHKGATYFAEDKGTVISITV